MFKLYHYIVATIADRLAEYYFYTISDSNQADKKFVYWCGVSLKHQKLSGITDKPSDLINPPF